MENLRDSRPPLWPAALLLLGSLALLSAPGNAAEARTAGMAVDFVNRAGEAVRVRIPEGVPLDHSMNLVVLDPEGRQVARIFPMEIEEGFFWSGPLEPRELALVKEGYPVVRADLDPGTAQKVRAAAQARAVTLREEEKKDRREKLGKRIRELEDRIRSLRDDEARIEVRRQEIALESVRQLRDLLEGDNRIQERIDAKFDERDKLFRAREDLADQLLAALDRPATPPGEVELLRRRIAQAEQDADRLSRDIRSLRAEERKAREESLDAEEERQKALLEREKIRYEIKGLEEDKKALQAEMSRI